MSGSHDRLHPRAGPGRRVPEPGRSPRYAGSPGGRRSPDAVRVVRSLVPPRHPGSTTMPQRAQRLIDAARKLPCPRARSRSALGLMISGLTTYGFQILAFKAPRPSRSTPRSTALWILVFVVAPGFFLPLEQEVGRAVAHRAARGSAAARRRAGRVRGRRPRRRAHGRARGDRRRRLHGLADRLFHGQEVLLACFVIALATLRGAAPHAGHALGQRPLRALRHDPRAEGVLRDRRP